MNLKILYDELINDPLVRGYTGMTNEQAATSLNTANRSIHKISMSGSEVLQNVLNTEYNSLTVDKRNDFWGLLGIGTLDPWGKEADVMVNVFGAGSATIIALNGARSIIVSRGVELGLGNVQPGDVQCARVSGG